MIRQEKSKFIKTMEELTRQGIKGEELDRELAIRFCNVYPYSLVFKKVEEE